MIDGDDVSKADEFADDILLDLGSYLTIDFSRQKFGVKALL